MAARSISRLTWAMTTNKQSDLDLAKFVDLQNDLRAIGGSAEVVADCWLSAGFAGPDHVEIANMAMQNHLKARHDGSWGAALKEVEEPVEPGQLEAWRGSFTRKYGKSLLELQRQAKPQQEPSPVPDQEPADNPDVYFVEQVNESND